MSLYRFIKSEKGKRGSAFLIFFLIYGLAAPHVFAETPEDQYERTRREQIEAKQSRANDVSGRIEVLQKQLQEERDTSARAQEKIWKDFMNNLETERSSLKDQMSGLDERQKMFERELEKKRGQDDLRIKEKEDEVQRLMLEMQRLRTEMEADRKAFEEERKQRASRPKPQPQSAASTSAEQNAVTLESGAVKVGETTGREAINSGGLRKVQNEYYVEVGDTLTVDVWRVPDLSRSVTVRPDGRISMPVVGDLNIVGMDLIDVRKLLTEKFSDYVWNPQVSISITQFGGHKFIILGEVGAPGVYRYQQDVTLVEAIALAGGFNDNSKQGKIMIIRGDIHKTPQVKIITANMENVLRRGMISENLTIMSNDIIYVGRDFLSDYNQMLKDVIDPSLSSAIDFFVLRSAIRTAQDRRN